MKRFLPTGLVLAVFTVAFAACGGGPSTQYAESISHGGGTVRSYITTGALDGQPDMPLAIGIEMSASALEDLPNQFSETVSPLPEAAASTPFRWATVDWNPHGHAPEGVYNVPHLDFHFYIMEQEARAQIRAGSCPDGGEGVDCETFHRGTEPVGEEHTPHGHRDVGAVVPGMGNHLIDTAGPEFTGQDFTHTFIFGSFDGDLTFYEPMITLSLLEERPADMCADISQPERYAEPGNYPTQYCVRYHQDSDTYTVSLEEFVSVQQVGAMHGPAAPGRAHSAVPAHWPW